MAKRRSWNKRARRAPSSIPSTPLLVQRTVVAGLAAGTMACAQGTGPGVEVAGGQTDSGASAEADVWEATPPQDPPGDIVQRAPQAPPDDVDEQLPPQPGDSPPEEARPTIPMECWDDEECEGEAVCVEGVCVESEGSEDGLCESLEDCDAGFFCDDGQCAPENEPPQARPPQESPDAG